MINQAKVLKAIIITSFGIPYETRSVGRLHFDWKIFENEANVDLHNFLVPFYAAVAIYILQHVLSSREIGQKRNAHFSSFDD